MPAAEVDVSVGLVERLLAEQMPDLAGLPLRLLANGWDNVLLRLGDDLVVRLPRRALAAALVDHELRWLPTLAPRLPLPVPVPVRAGRAALGYPWSWSVVPYLPGDVAARTPPDDEEATATAMGAFLAALHEPAPADAPVNPFRGVPLPDRADAVLARLDALPGLDRGAVLAVWHDAAGAPPWSGPPLWLHGDLHPANVLVHRGRVGGIIDFGDVTAGDPATDLAVAWTLLPLSRHGALREAYGGVDDDTWVRARGWALALSLAYLAHSADEPVMAAVGRRGLRAVLAAG